ncbi:MAG TPA: isochorismate synthase [Pseudogracilibacillus sp.]|nr:isochorismate synthase [Pseudogracilibacillus sp.]
MVELKEDTLESLLNQVKINTQKTNESLYASYTKVIPSIQLIDVFKRARKIEEDRSFWHSYSDGFTSVGIGETVAISDESDSSETINRAWRNLVDKTTIHNPYEKVGSGMLAMGGLAFDPKKEKTSLWENYPAYELIVPKVSITQAEVTYLTINLKIETTSKVEEIIKEMNDLVELLLSKDMDFSIQPRKVKSKLEIEPEEWKESVSLARDAIIAEKAKKIVLAREMRLTFEETIIVGDVLEKLIETQPNSYIFAIEKGSDCFVGATPERLVKVTGNELLSTCLAGTTPRGQTEKEDEILATDLLNDAKNRKEHDYVVQMIKRSIDSSCDNINIPDEPIIYPLPNLQHLYTPVTADLKTGNTIIDLVKELHPTPALGGLPNEAALQFIRDHERLDRGWYGAPVGWLDDRFNGEFAVAIRSGLIQADEASIFAGCGVMKDSDPELEYEETNVKFLPMLNVLEEK